MTSLGLREVPQFAIYYPCYAFVNSLYSKVQTMYAYEYEYAMCPLHVAVAVAVAVAVLVFLSAEVLLTALLYAANFSVYPCPCPYAYVFDCIYLSIYLRTSASPGRSCCRLLPPTRTWSISWLGAPRGSYSGYRPYCALTR